MFARPMLELAYLAWFPITIIVMSIFESAHKDKLTARMPVLKKMSYRHRQTMQTMFDLFYLDYPELKRVTSDLMLCNKILNNLVSKTIDFSCSFQYQTTTSVHLFIRNFSPHIIYNSKQLQI